MLLAAPSTQDLIRNFSPLMSAATSNVSPRTHHLNINLTICALVKRKLRSLRSTQILSERSAVPAVFSRPFLSSNSDSDGSKPRTRVSASERAHLARLAHRSKDPLEGRARMPASEAVKKSGKYDVWAVDGSDEAALVKAMRTDEAKEYLLPIVRSHKARVGNFLYFIWDWSPDRSWSRLHL